MSRSRISCTSSRNFYGSSTINWQLQPNLSRKAIPAHFLSTKHGHVPPTFHLKRQIPTCHPRSPTSTTQCYWLTTKIGHLRPNPFMNDSRSFPVRESIGRPTNIHNMKFRCCQTWHQHITTAYGAFRASDQLCKHAIIENKHQSCRSLVSYIYLLLCQRTLV